MSTPLNIFYCFTNPCIDYYIFLIQSFHPAKIPQWFLTSSLIDYLPSKMPLFFSLVLLMLGLHCAPPNSCERQNNLLPFPNKMPSQMYPQCWLWAFNLYRRSCRTQIRTSSFPCENLQDCAYSPLRPAPAPKLKSWKAWDSTLQAPQCEIQQGFSTWSVHWIFQRRSWNYRIQEILFIGKQLKPLEKFLDDVKNLYETEVFSTDFSSVSGQQEIQ